jgi:Competence protein CoiA-like family
MQHYAGRVAENQCGNLVYATLAMRTVAHVCIECKQPVVLRKGKTVLKNGQMMVAHFAHKSTNVTKCGGYTGGETLEHLEAKWLLANHIEDFRFVMQSCNTCQDPNTEKCIKFTKDAWNVLVEGQIAGTGTGANAARRFRRADVLVQLKSQQKAVSMKPWYSLEVKYSHPVSAEKTKELHNVNCGIIEVLAEDVLEFKDIPESDKPCYLRNEHTIGCIPWTCAKCMADVALERAAIWIDYEEWYDHQWMYQDALIRDTRLMRDRSSKRKVLQAQGFESTRAPKRTRFEKTSPYWVKCVACHIWINRSNPYHTFNTYQLMTDEEQWWKDAIKNDEFLAGKHIVKRMVYCMNCVGKCVHCNHTQPIEVLKKYGLCRLCNTDDDWFDRTENQKYNTENDWFDRMEDEKQTTHN